MRMTTLEKEVKQRKIPISIYMIIFASIMMVYVIWTRESASEIHYIDDWTVQLVAKEYPIRDNEQIVLHVVALDDQGEWVEGAEVTVSFSTNSVLENELEFYHIEDGLYENITHFPVPGILEGMIDVTRDGVTYSQPIQLTVLSS